MLLILLGVFQLGLAQVQNPVSWHTKAVDDKITMTATIDSPWHMYDQGPYSGGPNATLFVFTLPEGVKTVGKVKQITKPTIVQDEIFKMQIGYFAGRAVFEQTFLNTTGKPATIKGMVEWQVCDDESCLPPMEYDFEFKIAPSKTATAEPKTAQVEPTVTPEPTIEKEQPEVTVTPTDPSTPTIENKTPITVTPEIKPAEPTQPEPRKSLWPIIIEAILWGFAALLTPCVFPMVPMTVSFFLKNSGSKKRGQFLAFTYGISIIALYTIPIAAMILITYFGGGEAITADIFNALATHWLPNVLFSLIFIVFAISFFGAFEITMPSKWVNRSDSKSDRGGLIGTFFMAMTLVLVSFSCTGPIVGIILVKSTQGDIWEPIITMLAFSTAFALPFTLFAFFPSLLKNLPKSGGWLNSVKVVLGFIELALALKFLSVADQVYHWRLLDREVYLALWIVIFTLMGFYLLGKLKFAHDDKLQFISVKRLLMSIVTFSFVVYMIPGLWGAPLKFLSGYLPPVSTLDFNLTPKPQQASPTGQTSTLDLNLIEGGKPKYSDILHFPHGIEGFFDYKQGLEYARKVGKPVMIDFTGHGCVNCREVEANIWSDPRVLSMIKNDYVLIALYVDDRTELPKDQWVTSDNGKVMKTIGKINSAFQISKYKTNAQPYYVLMNPQTEELLTKPRAANWEIAGYIEFMKTGLQTYAKYLQEKPE